MRDAVVGGDRTLVAGDDVDLPWYELAHRLEEAAIVRVLDARGKPEGPDGSSGLDQLWAWDHPLAELAPPEGTP